MRSRKMLFGRKLNNRGMSLVEVIIAITILGIVAVPVLHSLTTAMVYNQKARIRQEMTLTAESIMETFKGYDLETLKKKFDADSVDIQGLKGDSYECTPDTPYAPEQEYVFEISKLLDAEGNPSDVDVKITATPNGVETVMVPDKAETTREAIFTGKPELDAEALQKAKEAFKTDENKSDFGDYLVANYADAVARSGNDVITIKDDIDKVYEASSGIFFVEQYVKLLERRLEFKIEQSGTSGDEYHVTSKMVYKYCIEKYPYYVLDEEESGTATTDLYGGTDTDSGNVSQQIKENDPPNNKIRYPATDGLEVEVTTDEMIYKNPTTAGLDSLFVYYYPQYDVDMDKIVIDNDALIEDFKCYIFKQSANIPKPTLEVKDGTYKPTVKIIEHGKKMKVFHNLEINLGDTAKKVTGGASGIEDNANVKKISYYKAPNAALDPEWLTAGLVEKKTLSYKITLEMWQNGNLITQLDGSMNEPINTPNP